MSGPQKLGESTYLLRDVYLEATSAVVGPKEGEGPLARYFDRIWPEERGGESSFEKAEQALLTQSQGLVLEKAGWGWEAVDLAIGGDLLDQLVSTNFVARSHGRPLLGCFSACATFTEAMALGSMLIAGGGPQRVMASAVSHHLAVERQFRFPIELGYQRTPTAAWTATAAGSALLGKTEAALAVEAVTVGKVIDWKVADANDMGTAMTPAAVDTIVRHLEATGTGVKDYSRIFTGDLGDLGVKLARHLARTEHGVDLDERLDDCGLALYDRTRQDVHNGGSGAGCSASVFGGYIVHELMSGRFNRVLLVATGALFSPLTYQQGESIPAVAHAVSIRAAQPSPSPSGERSDARAKEAKS